MSRIVNNSNMAAVRQGTQIHHQHHQVIQQNMRMQRQQMMNRALLAQVAQTVAPATVEDLQELVEISLTAESESLDFAQVVERIQERTPFATLIELLPRERAELYALLAVLVAVLELILNQRPTKVEVVSPDQVEHIIERVIERQQQTEPPSTTEPDC